MPDFAELVLVGRVVKPQGRRGELAVLCLSDRQDRFPTLQRVFLPDEQGRPYELRVLHAWPHKGRFVLKLEGVDSIEAAERLRGLELRIPEEELQPLPEGSYYHHQLAGLSVVDTAGAPLGVVQDVLETGAAARVLVVKGEGGETLLPFAESFVRRVDLGHRLLVVERPEYVLAD
ncbi:MAG TPA: ribosome maturation factor RimM [Vicinamibacteria bacterium]|nr:ribosome maturation factor RimM [Vicinamibacteria bacterium]